jgi:hypothetical protein
MKEVKDKNGNYLYTESPEKLPKSPESVPEWVELTDEEDLPFSIDMVSLSPYADMADVQRQGFSWVEWVELLLDKYHFTGKLKKGDLILFDCSDKRKKPSDVGASKGFPCCAWWSYCQ